MKKIFIYEQNLMNGTVTMSTEVAAFTSREVAEQTRKAIRKSNAGRNLDGLRVSYSDIKEINVYESLDEVPFFQTEEGKTMREVMALEPQQEIAGLSDVIRIGTPQAIDDYLKREREGKLDICERRPAWETADCWNALDYKAFERTFNIVCDEDATAEERGTIGDIVRQFSGVLTSEKVIEWVSDKTLRMKHDEDLNELIKSMRQTWAYRMPPMYFADNRPVITIDWQEYITDRKHGKITVTFKTEF